MNSPYFPPTTPCFDLCVPLIELNIDRTGLCISMLFLFDNSHLLRGGFKVVGDAHQLGKFKFLSLGRLLHFTSPFRDSFFYAA